MEWAIVVKVKFNSSYYTYFPFMWVDKDFALYRGIILGYQRSLQRWK
ncbi:MAG: acetoacetate decarboxylase family protein [Candidatus Aramenus sulfurataquae]|uniref:Acetoacetate decarboxylase family protein n=1 Tax=Candidatus Aramenus sulfurataquae TaxID=1326980 RepID=A0ACC6TR64_9CREN